MPLRSMAKTRSLAATILTCVRERMFQDTKGFTYLSLVSLVQSGDDRDNLL